MWVCSRVFFLFSPPSRLIKIENYIEQTQRHLHKSTYRIDDCRIQACLCIRLISRHTYVRGMRCTRGITFKSIDLASLPAPSRKISEESCEIPCMKLRTNGRSFNRFLKCSVRYHIFALYLFVYSKIKLVEKSVVVHKMQKLFM